MINCKILNVVNNVIKKRIFTVSSTLCQRLNYSCHNILIKNEKNCTTVFKANVSIQRNILIRSCLMARNISISKICYAKNKTKEKKKSKQSNLDFRELNELYDIEKLKREYDQIIENMKQEYIKNFSLRSIAGSIELIKVELEEKQYELQELAQIVRNPKLVILNVNFPTAIPAILNAITKSGVNINPQQDGTTIYLPIPLITKDYREKLVKGAKVVYIKYRDELKNRRSKLIKIIQNSSTTTDTIFRIISVVEKFTDQYLDEIENILITKQNELSKN